MHTHTHTYAHMVRDIEETAHFGRIVVALQRWQEMRSQRMAKICAVVKKDR